MGQVLQLAGAMLVASPAHAQLNGENLLGDAGVKSGSQAEPGFYVASMYYRYNTDTIKDANGNRVVLDPNQPGSQRISAAMPVVLYVSEAKLFGAQSACVMLTGMGSDGLDGTRDIGSVGGAVIAQDEASSIVWGMPGAIANAGLCNALLPLSGIAPYLGTLFSGARR